MSKKSILGKKVANKVKKQIEELLAKSDTEISDALQISTRYNGDTNFVECIAHIDIKYSWVYDPLIEARKFDELPNMVFTAEEKMKKFIRRLMGNNNVNYRNRPGK